MSGGPQPVIIVKKKINHGGHHGGAWKVAYADFVTAMMAFFLVMWLVNQTSQVKAAVGGYFRDPGVFDTQGGAGILPGGTSIDPEADRGSALIKSEQKLLESAVTRMKEGLEQVAAFKGLRDQVEFTVQPDGLRIDLIEKAESSFFDSGSATMKGETEKMLGVIARELSALDHEVDVEGHTDSRAYANTDRYTNWELSADRANAARRIMEREGLQPRQVDSVRGLADRQLRVPKDPLDPRNRRVSIFVKSPVLKQAHDAAPAKPAEPAAVPSATSPTPTASAKSTTSGETAGAAHDVK